MKNKLFKILVGLYLLCPWLSCAAEREISYICVSEESTGFYFINGKWSGTNFNVGDERFIIRKIKPDELYYKDKEHLYGVYELGKNNSLHRCIFRSNVNTYYGSM